MFSYNKRKREQIKYLNDISELFDYKIVKDEYGNEYILFNNNLINNIENITDKTEFESSQNHVHLIEKVEKREYKQLIPIAKKMGMALLCNLNSFFPEKQFIVFVTLSDSMVIRFHQKWENEPYFCEPEDFILSDEEVFKFE